MDLRPTGVVAASKVTCQYCRVEGRSNDRRQHTTIHICVPSVLPASYTGTPEAIICGCRAQDKKLARELQCLFASPYLRVNTTTDVTGVEICGALKNVLALAAGELGAVGMSEACKALCVPCVG